MPQGIFSDIDCFMDEKRSTFIPSRIQKETKEYFINTIMNSDKLTGLLLFHKLGSGKTCTSIIIADYLLQTNRIEHVYIFSSGSLRKTWITEYCDTCGTARNILKNKYTFITYNFNIKNIPPMNNSLIIIDEIHNIINGVKNESKSLIMIYNSIINALNHSSKVLVLSGTPIYSNTFEWSLLGHLLSPLKFPDPRSSTNRIDREWMENIKHSPAKLRKFKQDLQGVVSYYEELNNELFPSLIYHPPIKIVMSKEQEDNYWSKLLLEQGFRYPPSQNLAEDRYKLLYRMYVMSHKNVISRAASNFFYPKGVDDIIQETEAEAYKKKFRPDTLVSQGGWVEQSSISIKTSSMKFLSIILNVANFTNDKHVIYTFLKQKSGAILLKSLLSLCNITSEIFSGDLSDTTRTSILKRYNSEKNIRGDDIRVLLLTEAGGEGISLKDVKHLHITESSNKVVKTTQVIGRISRMNSHIRLPKDERVVNIWRYWSVSNRKNKPFIFEGHSFENNETIDEILYYKNIEEQKRIDEFLNILKEISIT